MRIRLLAIAVTRSFTDLSTGEGGMRSRVYSWYNFHRGKMCLPIDSIDKVADGETKRAIAHPGWAS